MFIASADPPVRHGNFSRYRLEKATWKEVPCRINLDLLQYSSLPRPLAKGNSPAQSHARAGPFWQAGQVTSEAQSVQSPSFPRTLFLQALRSFQEQQTREEPSHLSRYMEVGTALPPAAR